MKKSLSIGKYSDTVTTWSFVNDIESTNIEKRWLAFYIENSDIAVASFNGMKIPAQQFNCLVEFDKLLNTENLDIPFTISCHCSKSDDIFKLAFKIHFDSKYAGDVMLWKLSCE